MTDNDIFGIEYKEITTDQVELNRKVKLKAEELYNILAPNGVASSREMQLAITKLEESVLWATKAIFK